MTTSLVETNLAGLQKQNPGLSRQLAGHSLHGRHQVIPTKSGHHTILSLIGDKDSKFLHSPEDPVREAEELIHGNNFRGEDITVLLGLGLGYLSKAIFHHKHPEHRLIIIEADMDVIYLALSHTDLSDLLIDKHIYLFHTSQVWDITNALDKEQFRILGGEVNKTIYPPLYDLHPSEYQQVEQKIENWILLMKNNYNGLKNHSELTIPNILTNMLQFPDASPINPIADVTKGRPGLVIAAGPSLDKNLHQIKMNQAYFFIVAVDTALKPLLSNGIKPDLVVSVDPIQINLKKIDTIPSENFASIPFCFSPYVYPEIPRRFHGPKFIFNEHNRLSQWALSTWTPTHALPYGFSVAHYAFYIIRLMGASPIIFTGLDLAYSGNRAHVKNSADVWDMDKDRDDFPMVPDAFGNMVKTDHVFLYILYLFEKEIAHTTVDCIDASEGGAYIAGTKVMPFKAAAKQYAADPKPDYSELFQTIWEKNQTDSISGILQGISWLRDESRQIKTLSQKAILLTSTVMEAMEKQNIDVSALQPKIDSINRIADKISTHQAFKETVKDRLARVLVDQFQSKFQMERAADAYERLSIGIRQSHLFFNEMERSAGSIRAVVEPMLSELKNRMHCNQAQGEHHCR